MKRLIFLILLFALGTAPALGQRADLSGIKICIDPGHGGYNSNDRHIIPDPGTDFWESESNFQKALLLKSLLEAKGAWVILTRTTNDSIGYPNPDDSDEPSLTARVATANANNVDWFHSIHSNAFNASSNYTLVLVRENRSALGTPQSPEALAMAQIMSPAIQEKLRTTGNLTRFDYSFLGYSLGVLSGLIMPGELSEGSFHDVFPETRRLMNNHYRKMEAYALRNAIMEYYGVPPDPRAIIAGIQRDAGTIAPVNFTNVRILPENRLYAGDGYNNGFYMFDSLDAGIHTIRFETPDRYTDSVQVSVTAGGHAFADRSLYLLAPPTVVSTAPAHNDTEVMPNTSISIKFLKPMDTASVRAAFSIAPAVRGSVTWGQSSTLMVLKPDSLLPFLVTFTVRIDSGARATDGKQIDGNGDGTAGDPFAFSFRTKVADLFPPVVVAAYPADADTVFTTNQVVNVTFNEPLNTATVNTTNFLTATLDGEQVARTVEYSEHGGKGGVTIYPSAPLSGGLSYITVVSSVQDLAGNAMPSQAFWTTFRVGGSGGAIAVTIDSLNLSVVNWFTPTGSGSTVGVDIASWFSSTDKKIPTIAGNPSSVALNYSWLAGEPEYLIREYLSGGAPRSVLFRKEGTILQVYIHGDGSGTEFRFAVDDSVAGSGGPAANHEVSRWVPVDWVGWRLVEWDLESDSVGSWIGNGMLEGVLRFDSFQIRKAPGGSTMSGILYFDQLQLVTKTLVGVLADERDAVPEDFSLSQNYPNPFNPTTTIRFAVPRAGRVTIRVYDLLGRAVTTLADGVYQPGTYSVRFDAAGLASGTYFYRMEAPGATIVRKMLVTK